MDRLRLLTLLVAMAGLGACNSEPERSVEWYRDNPKALQAKLVECAEQAQLASSADGNCARAQRAATMRRPVGTPPLRPVTED